MTLGVFRNSAGSLGGSATPQNPITVPRTGGSPVQNTDLCVLFVCAGGGTNSSAAPDGTWATVKADTTVNAGAFRYAAYRKIIGADTTITPSWPTAPATGNNTCHLAVFYSGDNNTESVGAPTSPGAASTATICAATSTTGPDRTALAVAMMRGTATGFASSVTWTGGFTVAASQFGTSTFHSSISVAALDEPTATATTDQTATWNLASLNQVGFQLALVPSVVPLQVTANAAPNSGVGPFSVTLTVTATGGNGNAITYDVTDWGDGATSASQSSNVFTHTYAAVGSSTVRNGQARATQA